MPLPKKKKPNGKKKPLLTLHNPGSSKKPKKSSLEDYPAVSYNHKPKPKLKSLLKSPNISTMPKKSISNHQE
jgi:hypothetical protein